VILKKKEDITVRKGRLMRLRSQIQKKSIMTKIALIIMSDTESAEALGKVSNAFMLALESMEQGDDLKIIFEGAGTKWIGALEDSAHKLHDLYKSVKPAITGACSYCASAFGVKNAVEKAGITLLSEYKDHPSLRQLVIDGYTLISY
jgi:hypothetical protein